ncbi:hypothetical protein, partial [Bartonella sp. ML69XJBT]|uniref:hypothetical protein n=1 Tax=Bartonella sp. ML69XJBT TaxID=3019092 RepID=UPI00235FFC68
IHQYPQAAINFYHKLLAPASTNTPPAHNTSLTSPQIPPPTPPVLVIQTTFLSRKPHIFIKKTKRKAICQYTLRRVLSRSLSTPNASPATLTNTHQWHHSNRLRKKHTLPASTSTHEQP